MELALKARRNSAATRNATRVTRDSDVVAQEISRRMEELAQVPCALGAVEPKKLISNVSKTSPKNQDQKASLSPPT